MGFGLDRSDTVFFKPYGDGRVTSRSPSGVSRGQTQQLPRDYWTHLRRKERLMYGGASMKRNIENSVRVEEGTRPSFMRQRTDDTRLPHLHRADRTSPALSPRDKLKHEILKSRSRQYDQEREDPANTRAPAFRSLSPVQVSRMVDRMYRDRPMRFTSVLTSPQHKQVGQHIVNSPRQPDCSRFRTESPRYEPHDSESPRQLSVVPVKHDDCSASRTASRERPSEQGSERTGSQGRDAGSEQTGSQGRDAGSEQTGSRGRDAGSERTGSREKQRIREEQERIWKRVRGDTFTSKFRKAMNACFRPDPYHVRTAGQKGYFT